MNMKKTKSEAKIQQSYCNHKTNMLVGRDKGRPTWSRVKSKQHSPKGTNSGKTLVKLVMNCENRKHHTFRKCV